MHIRSLRSRLPGAVPRTLDSDLRDLTRTSRDFPSLSGSSSPPHDLMACGGSGPGGTGGCELVLRGSRPAARLTASEVATDTTLLFGEGRRAGMRRALAFASLSLPLSNRVALQSSLGGFVAGDLRTPQRTTTLGPGAATSLGLGVRAADGDGAAPLVVCNVAASGTYVTHPDDSARNFEAYDLRASGLVGKTNAERVTPYALGRVFGGPAFWRWDDGARVQGTDLYKFQVGGGVARGKGRCSRSLRGGHAARREVACTRRDDCALTAVS